MLKVDGDASFPGLFDRQTDYAELLQELSQVQQLLHEGNLQEAARQLRKLRKAFSAIVQIDYFPGKAQQQAQAQCRKNDRLNKKLSK